MTIKKVPSRLYKDIQQALNNGNCYDHLERYVLIQVLVAAKQNQPIEDVFIKCARAVFKRHPLDKSVVVA